MFSPTKSPPLPPRGLDRTQGESLDLFSRMKKKNQEYTISLTENEDIDEKKRPLKRHLTIYKYVLTPTG